MLPPINAMATIFIRPFFEMYRFLRCADFRCLLHPDQFLNPGATHPPAPPADEVPPLVLPPINYPPVLAPCADAININARIMETYLNDILPGGFEEIQILTFESPG